MKWSTRALVFISFLYAFWIGEGQVIQDDLNAVNKIFTNSCIEDLGCFYTGPPFFDSASRPNSLEPTKKPNVKFYLFTPDNPTELYELSPTVESVRKSSFNAKKDTKIVIHGFLEQHDLSSMRFKIKDALLKEGGYNVIIVDWSAHNFPPYEQAVANTRVTGAVTAKLIKFLMNSTGISPQSIHIIGHSLGAHTAGYVGDRVPNIGRITGLDPAGPFFTVDDPQVRLDPTDALFVDVIHTNAPRFLVVGLGIIDPIGHLDFYPNGGERQPGCSYSPSKNDTPVSAINMTALWLTNCCDHSRSKELFLESIQSTSCRFLSVRCSSYDDFQKGNCPTDDSTTAEMGFNSKPVPGQTPPTKYYLTTEGSSPFCVKDSTHK